MFPTVVVSFLVGALFGIIIGAVIGLIWAFNDD